jgi:hypothetical protein
MDKGKIDMSYKFGEEWSCHICKEMRPDAQISVITTDVSDEYECPAGTMVQNVRYCNDRQACVDGAKTHRLMGPNR